MPFWIKVAFWIVEAIGLWRLYREITRVRASTVRSGKPVAHHMRRTEQGQLRPVDERPARRQAF